MPKSIKLKPYCFKQRERTENCENAVTSQLPLLGSPVPIVTLTIIYLSFVLIIGPAYMKNRKPYDLRRIILVYNVLQIIVNFGLCFYMAIVMYMKRDHIDDIFCLANFPPGHPLRYIDLYGIYVYYLLKVIDLVETFFFVLRKSFKQVSFLHIYHHIMMALFVYYLLTYNGAAGPYIVIVILNSAVHGFMYSYYFLSASKPQMKQSVWWKKYITIIQLVQFVITLIHNSVTVLFRPQCEFSKGLTYFAVLQSVVMIALFSNFYIKAYVKKSSSKQQQSGVNNTKKRSLKQN